MSKRATRGSIAKKISNLAANISLAPNVNISKKQTGQDLLDISDEESVVSIIETPTPNTPSTLSKASTSTTTTTSPSSISSMSTLVSDSIHDEFTTTS